MTIYIVEDSALKANNIISFLSEFYGEDEQLRLFLSFQSGLKALELEPPGLVILDMTLPTFDRRPNAREGRLRPLGGYDIMRKLKLKNINTKVIVVTQLESFGDDEDEVSFKEITAQCYREFPEFFLGSVYYDQNGTSWRHELEKILRMLGGK
ncbi:response regulator [Pseudomonas putida]|uniref:response regulator n=1 Tax=Pseudomonas putida TaxID=303 RepID=UPI003D98BB97